MTYFVRKNLLQITVKFTPPGFEYWDRQTNAPTPPPTQPNTAIVVLNFAGANGAGQQTATVALVLQADGITWLGTWDSSAAGPGIVEWVAYGSGAVQASTEGRIAIQANRANNF